MANVMFFLVFLDYFPEQFTVRCYFHFWWYFFSSEVWSWWRCWRSFQVKVKTSNLTANYQDWTDLTINLNRLVRESGGLEETRSLAKKHATQASDALSRLLARKWSFKKKYISNISGTGRVSTRMPWWSFLKLCSTGWNRRETASLTPLPRCINTYCNLKLKDIDWRLMKWTSKRLFQWFQSCLDVPSDTMVFCTWVMSYFEAQIRSANICYFESWKSKTYRRGCLKEKLFQSPKCPFLLWGLPWPR